MNEEMQTTFEKLRKVMRRHQPVLVLVNDSDDDYYLNTAHVMKNGKPLFFGAVQIRKNYVSYHLMPVYVNPALLESASVALKKRMQGKSCFNFKSIEASILDELAALTEAGLHYYQEEGYLASGR